MPLCAKNSPSPTAPGRLIVISGPSGVGKSTVVAGLAKRHPFHFSVSATTRTPRVGEVDGVDYRFVKADEFAAMRDRGELLEWAEYSGRLYGTPRGSVLERLKAGEDVLLDVEVLGAVQVKVAFPESVTIFLAPPGLEELERRLLNRGDTEADEAAQRLEIARWQLEVAESRFDHVVVNTSIEEAVDEIMRILESLPTKADP